MREKLNGAQRNSGREVLGVTNRLICRLGAENSSSASKAVLARLRRSAGKQFLECPDIWPFLLANLPEEFLGTNGEVRYEEQAILSSLQLFAIFNQGTKNGNFGCNQKRACGNMGYSLGLLRKSGNSQACDRRFNVMITSSTYDEFVYHLRHLLSILKGVNPHAEIDWGLLAKDLFYYQLGYDKELRLSWACKYYRVEENGDN